ncbi:Chromate resistance protein ChrB [Paeniglutamicibacter cryotolerans]|uniref:Chromate resistance protein ChrB n=1 Tax=Paeniglutamicibacter cryotolerans TaxID=670079 RepID=UPI0028AF0448|nr:Chromate resistance protein ChrB [Paeniglutamicibacter cryotolerans]
MLSGSSSFCKSPPNPPGTGSPSGGNCVRQAPCPLSAGVWALPAGLGFQAELECARELCSNGGGTFAIIDASPRDEESRAVIVGAFQAVRVDEWTEFLANCGKFEDETAREVAKKKFTFAELEEEEQSLDRLRGWYRDLKKRDVLELPEAKAAEERLQACVIVLEQHAERVYAAVHSTSQRDAPEPGQVTQELEVPRE